MHTILVLNPGHFHAALTLRFNNPHINNDVYVYAPEGKELESFISLVEAFNAREDDPTNWNLIVYRGEDSLERLLAEKKGDIAVLAGKNDSKMFYINALVKAGINVLADKPWAIDEKGIELLEEIQNEKALFMDIMTERHEAYSIAQKEIIADKNLFGEFETTGDQPTCYKESIHHLYKTVNGAPLIRPAWYLDIRQQGEGIVDVTTHLVDLMFWMIAGTDPLDPAAVHVHKARRWSTDLTLEDFAKITKETSIPEYLQGDVTDGVLRVVCNGEFSYSYKNVPCATKVVWNLEAPEGGADTHKSIVRGTRADIIVQMDETTGFQTTLTLTPKGDREACKKALEEFVQKNKSYSFECIDTGFQVHISPEIITTHEEHFSAVLKEFLGCLDSGNVPEGLVSNLITKYRLLVDARSVALQSS